jgi:hypothetical protein
VGRVEDACCVQCSVKTPHSLKGFAGSLSDAAGLQTL